ncbi:hypothetical protein LFL97_40885 (plasmid) [Burkholderia sp. JSH-S8]|nr:hypothetical protein LFL97_40885 [Burkholderia sp. JSH-S8]
MVRHGQICFDSCNSGRSTDDGIRQCARNYPLGTMAPVGDRYHFVVTSDLFDNVDPHAKTINANPRKLACRILPFHFMEI